MITDFRKWVTYLGNNDTPTYTFPFAIKSSSEIVVVQLDTNVEPPTIDFVERGDVQINIQSIEFDSILGGGTITFPENLAAGKRIYIKVANDEPTQPSMFREQTDFKLRNFENALDYIVNQVTRLADKSQRSLKFADPFTHVESTVNLEMQEFPMAFGMPIMNNQALQLEMKPILQILTEQGVIQLITDAQADADAANARLDLLEPRVTQAEANIVTLQGQVTTIGNQAAAAAASALAAQNSAAAAQTSANNAAISAAAAAASAAAAVGASVSNRIQVIPYAPVGDGFIVDEEFDQEVFKGDVNNRLKAFAKMSQYFIAGRPIKLGFNGYTPTFDLTSKYKVQVKVTLVKNGVEVTNTVNQVTLSQETTVTAVASALKVFSFDISTDGKINGVDVAPNDALNIEIKRIDASANEDVALLRLLKQTFELSFA